MKQSKYNCILQDNTGMVIYNAATDQLVALTPQLANIFNESKAAPEKIKAQHAELYDHLLQKGIFVCDDADETEAYIRKREEYERSSGEYTITINPTLACNMSCWYCYESHKNMPAMSADVKQSVLLLIDKLLADNKLKKLNLSFFGGEPLLYFDKVVVDIINHAKMQCKAFDAKLSIHFTTNAYLLTDNVLKHLEGLDVSFQITLDGGKQVHDSVRKTKGGEPTYARIVEHIHQTLSRGFSVGVRFNYTAKSIPSFIDVVKDFSHLPQEQKHLVNFTFQRVWQDNEGDASQVEQQVEHIERAFEQAGLFVNNAKSYIVPYCYADGVNTAVVNYNGDLFKCTARDFAPKSKEGTLAADGTLRWNERLRKRMSIRHGSDTCLQCRIYPICHGGCSQMKLEAPDGISSCPKGYDDDKIKKIMEGRALYLLTSCKRQKSSNQ
ncbi:radical SAM protein [uncultured Prevotellamassilia sp.]|uniref:radical SAM/SPASM domain-containing protein n=1 Tax=uncultured Prevotellamassilia sp. TaxID=1926676 RepID=UPI002593425E|nr:radical SAM protein [uncultured Prevotellamassilia sp.]